MKKSLERYLSHRNSYIRMAEGNREREIGNLRGRYCIREAATMAKIAAKVLHLKYVGMVESLSSGLGINVMRRI